MKRNGDGLKVATSPEARVAAPEEFSGANFVGGLTNLCLDPFSWFPFVDRSTGMRPATSRAARTQTVTAIRVASALVRARGVKRLEDRVTVQGTGVLGNVHGVHMKINL